MPTITIFGNSEAEPGSFDYDTAELIGKSFAEKGFDIATGGYTGVMEAALKSAALFNVKKIGVTAESQNKTKNQYVDTEIKVKSYTDRLLKLIEIADAFVVLPGGTGTLLELSAVWALTKKGEISAKPIVCVGEMWSETLQTLGFYSEEMLGAADLIYIAETAQQAVEYAENNIDK